MESLQLSYELDTLSDIVEERRRLISVLKIEPSHNDNVTLKKQLNKVLDSLSECSNNELDSKCLEECSKRYNEILADISADDASMDIKLYRFEIPQRKSMTTSIIDGSSVTSGNSSSTKKVRFRDENLVSYEDEFNPDFMPYKDEPEIKNTGNHDEIEQERQKLFDSSNALEQTTTISPEVSNQDIFIQQQQQLLEQDSQLERLSGSIRTTHGISLSINYEVNEQNDQVLNDLESLLDNNGRNLDRAKRKLRGFEKTAKENGPCFIIVILIIVLILLLAVL